MKGTNKARLVGGLLLPLVVCFVSYGKTSSGQMGSLAISPDGKLIAINFEQGNTSFIYEIAVDTGVATRLTKAKAGVESSPAFSSDGKRIAFAYRPSEHDLSRIVTVNVDGSDLREWAPQANDFTPVFSPDGKTIVFGRSGYFGSYSPIAQPHWHAWNFYAADLDGTNIRQITDESFFDASSVSVSPDGKSMVVVVETLESSQQIAVYSLEQTGKRILSLQPHVPHAVSRKNPIYNCPNYAPDGKAILFMAASTRFDYDVYRLNPDTGAIEKLTDRNGYATDLRVSADGRTAAFLKWRNNWLGDLIGNQIYLLDLQSHKLTPLIVAGFN